MKRGHSYQDFTTKTSSLAQLPPRDFVKLNQHEAVPSGPCRDACRDKRNVCARPSTVPLRFERGTIDAGLNADRKRRPSLIDLGMKPRAVASVTCRRSAPRCRAARRRPQPWSMAANFQLWCLASSNPVLMPWPPEARWPCAATGAKPRPRPDSQPPQCPCCPSREPRFAAAESD